MAPAARRPYPVPVKASCDPELSEAVDVPAPVPVSDEVAAFEPVRHVVVDVVLGIVVVVGLDVVVEDCSLEIVVEVDAVVEVVLDVELVVDVGVVVDEVTLVVAEFAEVVDVIEPLPIVVVLTMQGAVVVVDAGTVVVVDAGTVVVVDAGTVVVVLEADVVVVVSPLLVVEVVVSWAAVSVAPLGTRWVPSGIASTSAIMPPLAAKRLFPRVTIRILDLKVGRFRRRQYSFSFS
jgi:hypothetical protein